LLRFDLEGRLLSGVVHHFRVSRALYTKNRLYATFRAGKLIIWLPRADELITFSKDLIVQNQKVLELPEALRGFDSDVMSAALEAKDAGDREQLTKIVMASRGKIIRLAPGGLINLDRGLFLAFDVWVLEGMTDRPTVSENLDDLDMKAGVWLTMVDKEVAGPIKKIDARSFHGVLPENRLLVRKKRDRVFVFAAVRP